MKGPGTFKTGLVKAAGLMSGTSLDGVDVAELVSDGERIERFGKSGYRAYSDAERSVLKEALGCWQGDDLDAALKIVQRAHLEALTGFTPELIGFHGQTLAHEPRGRGTHQLGDGDALAVAARAPVVWDFRSSDVQMGGEGAPLAPFFHFACAKWIKAHAPLAFLNLGGVGNITWIDPRKAKAEDEGALLAFDTGPANAPINDLMQQRRGQSYDEDGALARRGTVETGALELFLAETYFARMPPKSLDRDDFSVMLDLVRELSDADAAATMTAMSAAAVMQGMQHCPIPPSRVLVCGGGRHNPVMMHMLREALDCAVEPVETVGLDGDMLEAQAFAYLAIRVARGLPTSCKATTGVGALVGGGNISYPA
ncbi:anhydro-N-acetylmuramic acid kinase [Planktotalea arctica]|uniref:anhydro-N-acetylmuramic acid kinase n=1 Tax=Planktotalea arctica TaxID=1481893 RepID=UPI000A173702|nr:anhydro-N-acetylmuramic acid kinase [Planktotalea arctica]